MSSNDHPPHRPRKKMRVSVWTILAPLALAAIVIATFNIVQKSDVFDNNASKEAGEASDSSPAADIEVPATVKVKSGESLESIANTYGLDVATLQELNARLDDPQNLQVGAVIYLKPLKKAPAPAADVEAGDVTSTVADPETQG